MATKFKRGDRILHKAEQVPGTVVGIVPGGWGGVTYQVFWDNAFPLPNLGYQARELAHHEQGK